MNIQKERGGEGESILKRRSPQPSQNIKTKTKLFPIFSNPSSGIKSPEQGTKKKVKNKINRNKSLKKGPSFKDNAIKFYSFKTKAERSNPEVKEKLASEKKIKKREIDEITSPIANHPNELVMPGCVSGGEGHLNKCDSGDKTCAVSGGFL